MIAGEPTGPGRPPWRRGDLLGFVVGLGISAALSAAEGTSGCIRVSPENRPTWVTDAAWTDGGQILAIVDRNAGRILRFDERGSSLGQLRRPGPGATALNEPLGIEGTDDGMVVQDSLDRFLWIADGRVERSVDFSGRTAVLEFLAEPNGLVIFGTWMGSPPVQGFLRLRIEPPGLAEVLLPVSGTSPSRRAYALHRPVLARTGDGVYALTFDGRGSGIVRLPGRARLDSFPEAFEEPPTLPEGAGPEMLVPLYASVETSRMPIHLLGFGERLYLTTREPRTSGGTRWQVHRIDPAADRLEASIELPTSAAHLRVVPGPKAWALLEYGRVAAMGSRPLERLVLLPARWLTGTAPSGSLEARCGE